MRIETERLLLREFHSDDFTVLHELMSDPTVMEHVEELYDEDDTREFLDEYCIEEENALAVIDKASGKLIGCIQFPEGDDPEVRQMGWLLDKDFWGRGLAYEAAAALMSYGFMELKLHRIWAHTMDDIKAVGLMKKLGMTQEGLLRQHCKSTDGKKWRDRYYYGILREEYCKHMAEL